MNRFFLLLLSFLLTTNIIAQNANYSKMSSMIRQLAKDSSRESLAKGNKKPGKSIIAFVRSKDRESLERNGCKSLASWGDIHIARIPICNINALSAEKAVERIEAGKCCSTTTDTTRYIVNVAPVQYSCSYPQIPNLSEATHTGKGTIIGVQDIGFDLTHPNFWSQDGQRYRIKALWDMIARDDNYQGDLPVGVEYTTPEALLSHAHSADGLITSHGTHTSGIASGSGWEGTATSRYIGMAPEADLCLVSNFTNTDVYLVSKEEQTLYTTATDLLGFKYIFDYAESVGKPCVINFSEGSHEDLYECKLFYEVLDSLVGPGRIICSAAGNEGLKYTYLSKPAYKDSLTTFVYSNPGFYVLTRSDKELDMTLRFYDARDNNTVALAKNYSFTDIFSREDSTLCDTVSVNERQYAIVLCAYPTCYNDGKWAMEFAISNITESNDKNVGVSFPISTTIKSKDSYVEMFAQSGNLMANTAICPESVQGEASHNILFPSSSKSVISVGATAYATGHINYLGEWKESNSGVGGIVIQSSSTGPTLQGLTKPDVIAPGMNIISSFSSYYLESNPEAADVKWDVERFDYNGRTYSWTSNAGTSMSCPVVAGVIALWLEECPTLTTEQVIDVIANTSSHYDSTLTYPNNSYGWGQIDAKAGLEYIDKHYTGIVSIKDGKAREVSNSQTRRILPGIYDMNGRRVSTPSLSHGIYLLVSEEGAVRKIAK